MNNKILILVVYLILKFTLSNLSAQESFVSLDDAGYKHYAVEDTATLFECPDSIHFIMSGNSPKPTIFFMQGSSANSLFVLRDGKLYKYIVNVAPKDIYKNFNLVFISKPGIPIILPSESGSAIGDLSKKQKHIFDSCNIKPYYLSSLKQVYNYLKEQKIILNDNNYLMGHSQGYGIVAKYAAVYPDDFDKIVCMSSSIYNIPAIRVNQYYKKAYQGKESQSDTKNSINKVYYKYRSMYKLSKDTANQYYLYYRKDISLWRDLTIDYLIQIKKPLLVVYGMDDADASDNSVLPIIFISKHKENLSVFAYPNYGHNYYEQIYDAEGKPLKKVKHWHDVFIDVSNWLLE